MSQEMAPIWAGEEVFTADLPGMI